MRNISIVWDFDGTLTPTDSTHEVIKYLDGEEAKTFWENIHKITEKKKDDCETTKEEEWKHILALDAPAWMYTH